MTDEERIKKAVDYSLAMVTDFEGERIIRYTKRPAEDIDLIVERLLPVLAQVREEERQ